jgi:hypothetical protein
MLATYPQYSPQALMASPFGATLFAPPGLHAGNAAFGYEPGFGSMVQPSQPFAYHIPGQAPYAVAQQLVLALGQLAQQISMQSVVGQQIGSALQQLTQQIQAQTLPALPGFGVGQPYGQIVSPYIGATSPFFGATAGAYPGFSPHSQPAWQAWGGQRTQTIQ